MADLCIILKIDQNGIHVNQLSDSALRACFRRIMHFFLLAFCAIIVTACFKPILAPYSNKCNSDARIISEVPPVYPEAALRKGLDGFVAALITLDESGEPISVDILRSSDGVFDEAVKEAIHNSKFAPMFVDCKPVKCRYRKQFNFNVVERASEKIDD